MHTTADFIINVICQHNMVLSLPVWSDLPGVCHGLNFKVTAVRGKHQKLCLVTSSYPDACQRLFVLLILIYGNHVLAVAHEPVQSRLDS